MPQADKPEPTSKWPGHRVAHPAQAGGRVLHLTCETWSPSGGSRRPGAAPPAIAAPATVTGPMSPGPVMAGPRRSPRVDVTPHMRPGCRADWPWRTCGPGSWSSASAGWWKWPGTWRTDLSTSPVLGCPIGTVAANQQHCPRHVRPDPRYKGVGVARGESKSTPLRGVEVNPPSPRSANRPGPLLLGHSGLALGCLALGGSATVRLDAEMFTPRLPTVSHDQEEL